MKRIVVVGVTGSGKTTLAQKLASKTESRMIDLDDLFWLPGWISQPDGVFYDLADQATPHDENWVVAGNYSKVRGAIWPKADTLIWIDYPFIPVFAQLFRRTFMRAFRKSSICNGNYESFRKAVSKDSILLYLFQSYWKHRRNYRELFADTGRYPHMTYIRLGSRAETAHFIENFKNAGNTP